MLIFYRLRGWFFKFRMLRKNSYRAKCSRCRFMQDKTHRPCFHPNCHCWCSRFHGVKLEQAPTGWDGVFSHASRS